MDRDRFWLTDAQFARIEPHLPTDTRGKPRVDDRRVISGIVHVLKSGGRWIDAPDCYGSRKTLSTVMSAGPPRASGSISSMLWRALAVPRPRCLSTPPP
jgi:transposase